MRITYGLAAMALAGFVFAAPQAASAAPIGAAVQPAAQFGASQGEVTKVHRRWRGHRRYHRHGHYRGGYYGRRHYGYRRGYRRGYRGPGFSLHVGPRRGYYGRRHWY
jgi:hypothetical protein